MPAASLKVAISIPKDLYREVERTRKKSRRSRSAVVQEALRRWLKAQKEASDAQQYVQAYRRMPETPQEILEAEAMAGNMFAAEEWNDTW